ncbi:MAG: S41 family peptidase [Flavobacterium nitrogenifigens]|uniref:S41 family peptidase n=1 Tax=Flavobacterium nitrogenifigens TaxID=1617283 RepID=UPI00280A27B2|nr:S41 family peptidase [Flavobacterium nitrogenifigens]MDQ8013214.1 S41 family peptidase [Flavobacterium nitrogenifigens]
MFKKKSRLSVKKLLLLSVALFCYFPLTYCQHIALATLEKDKIQNLSALCKVWGFLKYYHPNVAKGNFNWDEQLLAIIPKIEKAPTSEAASKIYLDWIDSLGEIKICRSCKNGATKEYFDKNFNLSWTQNPEVFSNELSKKLKQIEDNRFQGKNHYVTTASAGNVEVINEPEYQNFEFPDENYRLLSLFRYWNIVEYFYPYKYMTDENWNEVLSQMIPKFKNSKNKIEYHLAMLETVARLNDSHATFHTGPIENYFGRKYTPAYFNMIESKFVITGFYKDSLAKANDLKIGDIIEKAKGIDVKELIASNKIYNRGSNNKVQDTHNGFFVTAGETDSIKLSIKRGNDEIVKNFGRYNLKILKGQFPKNKEKYKILDHNIGYVDMNYLEMKDVDKMMHDLKSAQAIIIDYREYMKFTPYMVARRLIKTKKEFAKLIKPDLSYPGRFIWKPSETISPLNNQCFSGRVIILVNEGTQSASEYATMLLQAGDNVTTIGSQTSGADGNVSYNEFLGYKSIITGLGVFYPDGSETQRVGIKIDAVVHPTIKGIAEGRDEILEKALEFAQK